MSEAYYAKINELNELWKKLEERVNSVPVEESGLDLSVARYGEKIRLLYKGRPLSDCTAVEKVEAVGLVPSLERAQQTAIQERMAKAADAVEAMRVYLATEHDD